jgi:serine/threonine protein kinase
MDNGRDVTELSDVWSLAVVAAEVLTGEIPFDTQQYRQLTVESFVDALANDIRPALPPRIPDPLRRSVTLHTLPLAHSPDSFASPLLSLQINLSWDYEVTKRSSAQALAEAFAEEMSRSKQSSSPTL